MLTIRAWRWGCQVILFYLLRFAMADGSLPELLSRGINAKQQNFLIVAVGAREKDFLIPNDRRRRSNTRERYAPGDIFGFTPCERQALLMTDAVLLQAAPLRPVFGVGARKAYERNN